MASAALSRRPVPRRRRSSGVSSRVEGPAREPVGLRVALRAEEQFDLEHVPQDPGAGPRRRVAGPAREQGLQRGRGRPCGARTRPGVGERVREVAGGPQVAGVFGERGLEVRAGGGHVAADQRRLVGRELGLAAQPGAVGLGQARGERQQTLRAPDHARVVARGCGRRR